MACMQLSSSLLLILVMTIFQPTSPIMVGRSNIRVPSPLKFEFSGYSIWLDLEQIDQDLNNALSYAASTHNVHAIPQPHVTVIYGVESSEQDARSRFECFGQRVCETFQMWPMLAPKGVLADREVFNENGATMSMAWMEISYKTSEVHEKLLDLAYEMFHHNGISARKGPWVPHLSLCYDNPEDSEFDLLAVINIVSQYPSLLNARRPTGISLWSTYGTMDEWKCLDRISFR